MNAIVKFRHADSPMKADDPLHYTACGLDNIYLVSGFQRRIVAGEEYVSVKDAEDLHKAIALSLARKKLLAGKEIRFLRKFLDYTQSDLGEWLGISDQSVARYEKDKNVMDAATSYVLRLLVLGKVSGCVNVHDELERLRGQDDTVSDTLLMGRDHDEWRPMAA
ncbi:MAG: hypothetical protein K2X61_14985 [Caulobacteraceae bacterium]|nr:hypothetical protein [Caulobacteraceae bacterium]